MLFTHTHYIDPTNIAINEVKPTKTPEENCTTSTLSTYASLTHSTRIDTPEEPDTTPLCLCIDASGTSFLESEGDLPQFLLMATGNTLFGVYQDWVYQNTALHLDEGTGEDGK